MRCDFTSFACHSHNSQMLKISAFCSTAEIKVLYVGHTFCVCLSLIIRCPLLKGISNQFRRLVGKKSRPTVKSESHTRGSNEVNGLVIRRSVCV